MPLPKERLDDKPERIYREPERTPLDTDITSFDQLHKLIESKPRNSQLFVSFSRNGGISWKYAVIDIGTFKATRTPFDPEIIYRAFHEVEPGFSGNGTKLHAITDLSESTFTANFILTEVQPDEVAEMKFSHH